MKYRTIVADPPWDYGEVKCNRSTTGTGAAVAHYPTMTVEEILSLPVSDLAENDAHLYLWVTNSFFRHGFSIVEKWGFEPKSIITWVKTYDRNGAELQTDEGEVVMVGEVRHDLLGDVMMPRTRSGLGKHFLNATEHVIFGIRGKLPVQEHLINVLFSPVIGHSVKPPEFYAMVDRASPDAKVELFARRRWKNWAVWGNEVESDITLTAEGGTKA